MNFRELLEAVKEKEFKILHGIVKRDYHLRLKRGNDNKPKDFAMSKQKYEKIIGLALDKMEDTGTYSIEWIRNNKKFVISLKKNMSNFQVFGAIMNSNITDKQLYNSAENVIDLGNVTF